jgi:hypothetical protein
MIRLFSILLLVVVASVCAAQTDFLDKNASYQIRNEPTFIDFNKLIINLLNSESHHCLETHEDISGSDRFCQEFDRASSSLKRHLHLNPIYAPIYFALDFIMFNEHLKSLMFSLPNNRFKANLFREQLAYLTSKYLSITEDTIKNELMPITKQQLDVATSLITAMAMNAYYEGTVFEHQRVISVLYEEAQRLSDETAQAVVSAFFENGGILQKQMENETEDYHQRLRFILSEYRDPRVSSEVISQFLQRDYWLTLPRNRSFHTETKRLNGILEGSNPGNSDVTAPMLQNLAKQSERLQVSFVPFIKVFDSYADIHTLDVYVDGINSTHQARMEEIQNCSLVVCADGHMYELFIQVTQANANQSYKDMHQKNEARQIAIEKEHQDKVLRMLKERNKNSKHLNLESN